MVEFFIRRETLLLPTLEVLLNVFTSMKFQEALASRNETVEEGPKLEWRVGIHVDDVIIEGDNIYGSGVNIVARLKRNVNLERFFYLE